MPNGVAGSSGSEAATVPTAVPAARFSSRPNDWSATSGISLTSVTSIVISAVSERPGVPPSVTSTVRPWLAAASWSSTAVVVISPVRSSIAKSPAALPAVIA